MQKPMTNELRVKIKQYIKNNLDISDLIRDVCIRGEDLSHAIIKDASRPDDDITGCRLFQATIGDENKITNFNRLTAQNCNFQGVNFLGKIWLRYADMKGSNFKGAKMIGLDYKFCDFSGCDFCNAVICIGSDRGTGAKFDEKFFKDLTENWQIEVRLKNKEKKNGK